MIEEILWFMHQRSRSLQDYRLDIRGSWDDEAAKTINTRYLNPHEADSAKMQSFLQQQEENLAAANSQIVQAEAQGLEAERLSDEVQHFQREQSDRAYHHYEVSRQFEHAASAQLPIIDGLIAIANSSC